MKRKVVLNGDDEATKRHEEKLIDKRHCNHKLWRLENENKLEQQAKENNLE